MTEDTKMATRDDIDDLYDSSDDRSRRGSRRFTAGAYLAFETATDVCSVAACCADKMSHREARGQRRHAEQILELAAQVLNDVRLHYDHLEAVVYGCGPGSFSGVRIAAAAAIGISAAYRVPVRGVVTLQNMAYRCFKETQADVVLSALDARMGEIYFAAYRRGQNDPHLPFDGQGTPEELLSPVVVTPKQAWEMSAALRAENSWAGCGTGMELLAAQLDQKNFEFHSLFPDACSIIEIAQRMNGKEAFRSPEPAMPLYVRNNVALRREEQHTAFSPRLVTESAEHGA